MGCSPPGRAPRPPSPNLDWALVTWFAVTRTRRRVPAGRVSLRRRLDGEEEKMSFRRRLDGEEEKMSSRRRLDGEEEKTSFEEDVRWRGRENEF